MCIKGKKGTWQTVLWIAAGIIILIAIVLIMNKGAIFQNQTFTSLKEKFFPFG